jgi:16S rRNA (uracil1498-N3)-methyltransferase
VEVFDGESPLAWPAVVREVAGDRVALEVAGEGVPGREPARPLTLATAVPKGERFDWLVEKAVEVGVARLVPLITARSVVDPRPAKLDRLRRAVVEASKQCGRNRLMRLDPPADFAAYLAAEPAPGRLLAHPGGPAPADWAGTGSQPGPAALAIGPEGGFSEAEVEAARAAGWRVVALGPTLLRIETAAIVGAAIVLAGVGGSGPAAGS